MQKSGSEEDLLYEVRGWDWTALAFNRPAAHNALTFEMYDRLGDICRSRSGRQRVEAIIITGAGGRACGGGRTSRCSAIFQTAQQGVAYEARMEAHVRQAREAVRYRRSRPLPASARAGRP